MYVICSGGHHNSRIYFTLVATIFMTIYALVMGSESRWSFFLPLIIFIQFYIFPVHEKRIMFLLIAFCVICFAGCEVWLTHHDSLIYFPGEFILNYKYVNSFGFLFCAGAMGVAGYATINKAEKRLAEEHLRSE